MPSYVRPARQCRGWGRYSVPCRNTTRRKNGLCHCHQHLEATADALDAALRYAKGLPDA